MPQIAAYADKHYSVAKEIKAGRTSASVQELKKEERVNEISRMLGGVKITERTKEHAKEMLDNAGMFVSKKVTTTVNKEL